MIKLSVVIITLNEEATIERCIQSVKDIADEIVVVDSLSTDNTVSIAKQLGAKIVLQPFTDYVTQRTLATEAAANDWIYSIDADEALSPELSQSILAVKQNPQYKHYNHNRCTNYCGKWIRHGRWYPDKKTRLFDRTNGKWAGLKVHEYWQPVDNSPVGNLKGDLLHYSFNSISDHIRQIEKFSELSARAAVERGKDCSILKIWLVPKWKFITDYIIRAGFLDGYWGYLVCKLSSMEVRIKYAKIRQYASWKREGNIF